MTNHKNTTMKNNKKHLNPLRQHMEVHRTTSSDCTSSHLWADRGPATLGAGSGERKEGLGPETGGTKVPGAEWTDGRASINQGADLFSPKVQSTPPFVHVHKNDQHTCAPPPLTWLYRRRCLHAEQMFACHSCLRRSSQTCSLVRINAVYMI